MKKALLALALLTPALAALADDTTDARTFYEKMAARSQREDLTGLLALISDNAAFETPARGKLGKKQWGEMIGQAFGAMDKFSVRYTVASVSGSGKTMRVRLRQVSSAVFKDDKGKPHTIEANRQLEDTLTRGKSGWQLLSSKVLSFSQKIDGKPVKA